MDSENPIKGHNVEETTGEVGQKSEQPAAAFVNTDRAVQIRGGSLRAVENMEASLAVPTATSYRTIPVKLLEENRRIINEYLNAAGRNRISFTHMIAWAIICSLKSHPGINASFDLKNGTPYRRYKDAVNLGIAVDRTRKDGTRWRTGKMQSKKSTT